MPVPLVEPTTPVAVPLVAEPRMPAALPAVLEVVPRSARSPLLVIPVATLPWRSKSPTCTTSCGLLPHCPSPTPDECHERDARSIPQQRPSGQLPQADQ